MVMLSITAYSWFAKPSAFMMETPYHAIDCFKSKSIITHFKFVSVLLHITDFNIENQMNVA